MDEMNNVNEAVEVVNEVTKTGFTGRQIGTLGVIMTGVAVVAVAAWEGGKVVVKNVKAMIKAKKEAKTAENIEVVE